MHFALSQHHWMKEGTSACNIIFILLPLNNEVGEATSYNKRSLSSKFSTTHTHTLAQLKNTRRHCFVGPRAVSMSGFAAVLLPWCRCARTPSVWSNSIMFFLFFLPLSACSTHTWWDKLAIWLSCRDMQAVLADCRLLIITFYIGETLSLNTGEHSPSSLQISTTGSRLVEQRNIGAIWGQSLNNFNCEPSLVV